MGKLFHPDYFPYTFKPSDSPLYGGQTRIDYLACDLYGGFWMVEVKQLTAGRKSFNLDKTVSAGQRSALDSVVDGLGAAVLAVGCGKFLYLFNWNRVRWLQQHGHDPLIPLEAASDILAWQGPRQWQSKEMGRRLHRLPLLFPELGVRLHDLGTAPMKLPRTPPSENDDVLRSISKPMDSIPTREEMVEAGLVR